MKGNYSDHKQSIFLVNGLSEQLNPNHLVSQLSRSIDCPSLEDDFTRLYSRIGSPAKMIRLMIFLLLLKQPHDPSDDQVIESWITLGDLAMSGKPYDGHTVQAVLKQLRSITETQPEVLIADRVYRGVKYFGKTQLLTPSKSNSVDSEYKKSKQIKRSKIIAGTEAAISHLKQDLGLGRCFLKGQISDQINVTITSADYNLRKLLKYRLE